MEIARRDGVIDKRTKILQALDTDPNFNNLPKVPGLGARLDASMQEREYDDVEDIMNELEDIYDEYTGVKKPEAEAVTTEEEEEVSTAPLSEIEKIKSKNAQLGESILQKLGFKIENRSDNGNVKGGQDGWKIRFNIKNSATGGSYYDNGKSTLVDDAYKDKVFKLVNFLNSYFNTEVSTGSLEKAQELTGKQGYYAYTKDKSNPSSIWKHLAGGEIGESDFTIYIGSADDVLKFISDIRTKNPEILELLHPGNQSGDILIDDIFKGRIEGADIGFSGYHVPTNLNKVIGSNDFIFIHNGRKVIISYEGKALTDITVISEETGKGYKGVFDENMKKDLPELYKNIRNIIGFQLYGKYLTGSNNEFVKLTQVNEEDLSDIKTKASGKTETAPLTAAGKSVIFKKYKKKISLAIDRKTLDDLTLEISKNKIGLAEEDKNTLLDLIQEAYKIMPLAAEEGMKLFQTYVDSMENITVDKNKTPEEQASEFNQKANEIINTAMFDTRLFSKDLPSDLIAKLFNLASEIRKSIENGTYVQKDQSNFQIVSKQIQDATTADELKKIKEMVDTTFTGKELTDLNKMIIDKLQSMPEDETKTDSYPVNETHDFSNVDEFNEDDYAEDINDIVNNNKEETGTEEDDKKNSDYTDDDDNIFNEFKSCNTPPKG
jgi:FtsZ-binding cell division protein ZapB